MKYLKIATTFLLLLAVVANGSFAAGSRTARRLQLPAQRESAERISAVAKKIAKAGLGRTAVQEPVSYVQTSVSKADRQQTVFTKTGIQIPKEILSGGLNGTFHIGTANQFKTLADMAFLMNIANISGPVTFLLDDASYTEGGVLIGGSPGASATNNITIRPNAGNTNCVITLTNVHANGGGFVFSGANNVTLEGTAVGEATGSRNLSIALSASPSSSQGGDAPVRLTNCVDFTVSDCNITGNSPSPVMSNDGIANGNASISLNATAGNYTSHVTINNNNLSGGHFGVLSMGNFPVDADHYGVQDDNIDVTNNYIHDVTEAGMKLYQVSQAHVTGNTVKRVVLGASAGVAWSLNFPAIGSAPNTIGTGGNNYNLPLWYRTAGIAVWGDEITVANNLVDSVWSNRSSAGTGSATVYGIRVVGFGHNDPSPTWGGGLTLAGVPTLSVVKNNVVTRVHCPNAVQANGIRFSAMGIALEAGRFDTVVHNTVYMSGVGTGVAAGEAAFNLNGVATSNHNGGRLSLWFSNAAGIEYAYSYRTKVTDNIFAVDRTNNGTDNVVLAIQNAGGVVDYRGGDYNVLYMGTAGAVQTEAGGASRASVYDWQVAQAAAGFVVDTHSQADNPTLVSQSDASISPTGLSTADGTGIAFGSVPTDFYGVTRGTPPDIGAIEGTGAGAPHDTKALALVSPGAAGVPQGLPVASFSVNVLNLGGSTETGVPLNIHVIAPDLSFEDFTTTFTAGAGALVNVTVPGPWTPTQAGTYTLQIATALPGDSYPANDGISATVPVNGQATVPYYSGFEAGELTGWYADGDFGLGTTGGKLSGPHGGTSYYVTSPGANNSGTHDKTVSNLYSPYFDFTGVTSATVSLYHSISTEPSWDRSIIQYSLDTGKTWHSLGGLNDANGINWYSTAVYHNAAGQAEEPDCWDQATSGPLGFPSDNPGVMPAAQFSSNGDCEADGPSITNSPVGYVLISYKFDTMPAETTPLGHSYVRFRYVTFTDAGTHGDGWAIDDFRVDAGPTSSHAGYSGKVYNDVNGNGTFDGSDLGLSGKTVSLTYFGGAVQTTTTDPNGDYSFAAPNDMYLPGVYNIFTDYTGGAVSQQPADVNYLGDGTGVTGKNLGYYTGSISGQIFSDVNDNGANNSEPGFSGFVVDVHADSVGGEVVSSVTTTSNGLYTVQVVPGNYVVVPTAPTNQFRQTLPAVDEFIAVTVSGDGNTGTSVLTGNDFGYFKRATVRLVAAVDQNGNGTVDGADITALPTGKFAAFTMKQGETILRVDTLGSGTKEIAIANIDAGSYSFEVNELPAPDGFMRTTAASRSFTISASATLDTTTFMWYKYSSVAGKAYNDVNGNGTKDGGDDVLAGLSVKLDGVATTTTDSVGNYSITGLHPGSHTVTLAAVAGYTVTGTGASGYTFTPNSGQNLTGKDFGRFQQFTISGTTYRDRDFDGANTGSDSPLAGVVVSLSKDSNPLTTANSDADGNYVFSNLGPGSYVVSTAAPSGYIQTEPTDNGTYSVSGTSGTDATGKVFGFFHEGDELKFRTVTVADIIANGTKKPAKDTKADTVANMSNLVTDMIANLYVGVVSVKPAAWMQPNDYKAVAKSVGADGKSPAHSGTPSGFDFTAKGKVMAGRYKALPSSVQDNALFANLLALNLNVVMSENGAAPAGLGSLIINNGGSFNGMTISAFVDSANWLMTNWKKIPQSTFDAANTLAAAINDAFNAPFSYNIPAYHATKHVTMEGVKTVYEVSFLKSATSMAPKIRKPGSGIENNVIPTNFALYQNYPNPFNPVTNIRFDLPMSSVVTVKIYNMLGQEVATLYNHEQMEAGVIETSFDATSMASGVYFYHIAAEGMDANGVAQTFNQVKKMALVK